MIVLDLLKATIQENDSLMHALYFLVTRIVLFFYALIYGK